MKKRYIILLLAVLGFFGYVVYYGLHMLKEPLYIQQYQELLFEQQEYVGFQYFGNEFVHNDVIQLDFPELKDANISYTFQSIPADRLVGHYKRYYLNVQFTALDREKPTNIELTKMNVHYSNGKKQSINFGKIVFKSYSHSGNLFEDFNGGHGTNSVTFVHKFEEKTTAKEDIQLVEMNQNRSKLFNEILPITINNNNSITPPLSFKKGEQIVVQSKYQFKKDDPRKCNTYRSQDQLVFKNESGETDSVYLLNLGFENMCYYQKDLLFYINKLGKTYLKEIF